MSTSIRPARRLFIGAHDEEIIVRAELALTEFLERVGFRYRRLAFFPGARDRRESLLLGHLQTKGLEVRVVEVVGSDLLENGEILIDEIHADFPFGLNGSLRRKQTHGGIGSQARQRQ
jgi:hypothetical protein